MRLFQIYLERYFIALKMIHLDLDDYLITDPYLYIKIITKILG